MPQHGQIWTGDFSSLGDWGAIYSPWLLEIERRPTWPSLDELTALIERERRRRAPQLPSLRCIHCPPRSGRTRRGPLTLEDTYDASIAARGEIPCLPESYHDLFNALAFAAFPRAKRELHERHYRALRESCTGPRDLVPAERSRERDALTLLDERGGILLIENSYRSIWRSPNGRLDLSDARTRCRALLFGHGVLERLQGGHAEIRTSCLVLWCEELPEEATSLDTVDLWLTARLRDRAEFLSPLSEGILVQHTDGSRFARASRRPE